MSISKAVIRQIAPLILTCATMAAAPSDYVTVALSVTAPASWKATIKQTLELKLNAIPDVQVVEKSDEALFTVLVDVNEIRNKSESLLGYSMMALIWGNYDQRFMSAFMEEVEKNTTSREEQAWTPVLKYIVSGNVFLAGYVHTHGSTDAIDDAYDEIVAKLKTNAIPEYRRLLTVIGSALKESQKKALPTRRN